MPHSGNGNLAPSVEPEALEFDLLPPTPVPQRRTPTIRSLRWEVKAAFCLACHDGTVAAGDTVLFGKIAMSGSMYAQDNFGTQLQGSHPFSLVRCR